MFTFDSKLAHQLETNEPYMPYEYHDVSYIL